MKKLTYQVIFLSDIILPATANTQGNISQLDFIPGSNFLGMVAKNYTEFKNSFNIFHTGAVKFGDATILKNEKQTYKMPLSYVYEKLNKNIIYNHHKITNFKEFRQLKQLRNDYITKDNETISIQYNYSQKSAYDKENRRSLDNSMFGYSAIQSGTKWQFTISVDDSIVDNDLVLLKNSIIGTKRLGKSKSAQYGLIDIIECGTIEDIEEITSNEIIIYANSRLALFDDKGNPTYDLKYLFDELKDENIAYDKCQIKTSSFTPYNTIRQTKDYEKVCINKGSVIVLKNINKSIIPKYVGAYQNEGFGELLINPKFLYQNKFELKSNTKEKKKDIKEIKSNLALFLKQKENIKKDKLYLLNRVDKFIENKKNIFKDIKSSQWGKIRSICKSGENELEQIEEYISNGIKKWDDKPKSELLEIKEVEFLQILSIQMPKVQNGGN